ncbi:hypothetical protein AMAG_05268 [Allomyces macrogynus ATCC 38327]|uniref:Uncharacterized protein n=1 Tax=Allomyces macrogynus (strain ATCC 38327) TaxID=578462 RepID=A0A0L0SBN3_ALLM3|nr:hypothetical protein AMAG_05268 [Allomyces macrogynus ATCC 38327]|eukprot:KNE59810.1 hypothetical protein AMAG_05268 [Allomyces macrogynus ATCC 38327]
MHAPLTPPWTDAAGTMATTARTSRTASRAGASKPAPSIVDETIVLATAWSQDDRGVETVMSTLLEANGDILLATEVNNPHADAEASVTYQLLGQLAPSGRIVFASNEYAAGAPVLAVQPDGTYATPEDAANAVNNRYRSPPEAIAALIRNMPGALRRSLFRRGSRDGMGSGTPPRTGSVSGPAPPYEVAIAQSSNAAADAWVPHPPPSTDWIPHPPTESPPPIMTLSRPNAEPEPLPSKLPSRLSRPRSGAGSSTPGTPAAAALLLARSDVGKRGSTASDVSSVGSPTAKPLDGTFLAALADTVVHQDAGGDGTLGSPLPTPLPPTLARGDGGGGTAAGATSPALSTICEDDDDSLAVAAAENNARAAEAPALAMAAVVPAAGNDIDAGSAAAAAAHAMQVLDLGPDPQSLLLLHADPDDHDHTDIEDLDDDPTAAGAHPYRFVDVRNGSVSVPSTAPASPTTLRPNSAAAAAAPTPTPSSSTAPNSAMPSPPVSPPGTVSPAHHHHHDTDDESDYAWDADADTDLGEPAAPGLPRALPPTFARVPHVSDEYLDHLSNIDGPTSSSAPSAAAATMTSLGSTIVNPPSRHASLRRVNKHQQRPPSGHGLPPVPHDDWTAAASPAPDDVPPVPWPHETLVVGHEDDAHMATLVPAGHSDAHLATMVPTARNGHGHHHHDGAGWDHAPSHSAPATTTPPRLNPPGLAMTSTASPQIVYHSLDDFGAANAPVTTTTTINTNSGASSPSPGDTPSSRGKSLLTRLKRAFANVKHAQAMVPPPVPPPLTTIARRRAAAGLDPATPTTLVRASSAPECSTSSSSTKHAPPRFDTLARLGDPGAAPVAPDTDALQHLESVAAMGTLLPSAAAVAAAVVDPVPQPSVGVAHYDELCGHAGHGMPGVPHDVFYGDDGGGGSGAARRRHEAETQAAAVTGVVYHF